MDRRLRGLFLFPDTPARLLAPGHLAHGVAFLHTRRIAHAYVFDAFYQLARLLEIGAVDADRTGDRVAARRDGGGDQDRADTIKGVDRR